MRRSHPQIPQSFMLIGIRAATIAARYNREADATILALRVMFVHERMPLRLQELLEADDGNFAHDVFGIDKHYDIATGTLRDCFVPRFAVNQ